MVVHSAVSSVWITGHVRYRGDSSLKWSFIQQ